MLHLFVKIKNLLGYHNLEDHSSTESINQFIQKERTVKSYSCLNCLCCATTEQVKERYNRMYLVLQSSPLTLIYILDTTMAKQVTVRTLALWHISSHKWASKCIFVPFFSI